jgi:hypothetical protein
VNATGSDTSGGVRPAGADGLPAFPVHPRGRGAGAREPVQRDVVGAARSRAPCAGWARRRERRARTLRDALVDRLAPRRPDRAGRGRVRVIVRQIGRQRARPDRPRRLEAGERQPVDVHAPRRAVLVVARRGDLLRAHPVAQEEDDVLRLPAVELGADGALAAVAAARPPRTTRRYRGSPSRRAPERERKPPADGHPSSLSLVAPDAYAFLVRSCEGTVKPYESGVLPRA